MFKFDHFVSVYLYYSILISFFKRRKLDLMVRKILIVGLTKQMTTAVTIIIFVDRASLQ
jgi:hypothetical protein